MDEHVTPDWNDMYKEGVGDAPDRQVSSDPLPTFGYYVVKCNGVSVDETNRGNLIGRISTSVTDGPGQSVGKPTSGQLAFMASRVKSKYNEDTEEWDDIEKTPEEYERSVNFIKGQLARIQSELGFAESHPARPNDREAYLSYLSQFVDKSFVIEIRKRGNFNNMQFMSIAGLNTPVRNGKDTCTAYEQAVGKIAERNERGGSTKRSGGRLGTATAKNWG